MTGPEKIMLIRHGEKPPAAAGVAEDGSPDEHSLTVRGWQRAGALVAFFAAPTRLGIVKPATIVASRREHHPAAGPESAGSRPQQTVAPLRARIGAMYWDDIAVGDEDALIERLKNHDGAILVAWEHHRLHNIVAGFLEVLAPEWDGSRFDSVWILDRSPANAYVLSVVNQDLLAGDVPA